MLDLHAYHDFAVTLAKECGHIARTMYDPDISFEPKGDNSPVTKADLAINRLVIERCKAAYPSIGILGEEESSQGTDSELLWVCDPIDGTTPYALGMSASSFCLALVQDGQPVVAVIYDFMNDRMYHATKGGGARVNDKPMPQPDYPAMKLVSLEWWNEAAVDIKGFHEVMFAQKYQVPNFTSSAFTSMQIASGRIAGTVYVGRSAWDIVATKLIAEECGCIVRNLDGNEQRYDRKIKGAIIARSEHYQLIFDAVQQARAAAASASA
jgi:myo-inositol-1(or 4)-monophosphatase